MTSALRGAASSAGKDEKDDPSSGPVRPRASARVLLVDDSQFDRVGITHLLRTSDAFEVATARDADEAHALLQEQSFDCLLVDVHLPRQSGMELLQSVRQQFGKNCPPVILMTASDSRDAGVTALKGGADDFLNKDSLNASVLRTTVLDAINKRASEHDKEQRELESRMRSLGQLAAGIAHELNNPAAYVRVNLDLLEEALTRAVQPDATELSREEFERHLRLVQECSEGLERMTTIVAELQSFTKSGGSISEPVLLDEVVRSSTRFLGAQLRSVGHVEMELGGPPPVLGSRRRLVQVVVNLLTNAIDAANPDEPRLRLITRTADGVVELAVEDNGPGIPIALRERIFEPFFTTKGPGRGTGLGLSLCCEYITQAGGTLAVETSSLGGAKFRMRLPFAARRPATTYPPPSLTQSKSNGMRPTILAVDDEPSIQRAYARVLSTRYTVHTAGNGREALELLQQYDFDAVVCDLAMPDMGGHALLREIEERWPALAPRVIFCTGGDVSGTQNESYREGNRVLGKPVSKSVLEEAIEDLLDSTREPS